MPPMLRRLLLAAVLVTAGVQAARADVILTFSQTEPVMMNQNQMDPRPLSQQLDIVELSFVISDTAYASGVDWTQYRGRDRTMWLLDGLAQIYLGLFGVTDAFRADIHDLMITVDRSTTDRSSVRITSAPGGLPVGGIYYQSAARIDLSFNFNGTNMVSGTIVGDGTCFWGCTFNGTLAQSVPEPASILTFGIGLLALGVVTRQQKARHGSPRAE